MTTARPCPERQQAVAHVIRVSDELTIITGDAWPKVSPDDRIHMIYDQAAAGSQARLRLMQATEWGRHAGTTGVLLLVCSKAFRRLGGQELRPQDRLGYYLPPHCRAITAAIANPLPSLGEAARDAYSTAKAVELLCETLRLLQDCELVPLAPVGMLSLSDSRRIIAARDMIEQHCAEKLTLNGIARSCGINRAKLTRGFRDMFACTIAEAIANRRLQQAGRLLLTTDLPVGCIGHESGFANNASFARAFGRHYGRSPSQYRAAGASA